ncbi:MAG TPA: octaprenyl diphosphate synthase [Burkholderiales bacterium]|nr:octaprenyl diphosphate synthase [Burkholderiales bacterium]
MTASIDPIRALIAADMQAVDGLIRQRLASDVVLIRQVAEYIIASGGKRLRPVLLLLTAGACGYTGAARMELAAVVEFIHTATLLHDDVVDESSLRRGRETANAAFGNAASVLVGDFLYSRAFQMMVNVANMRVMEVLAEATNTIAEGEVLQLLNVHNADVSEADYLEVIRRKTAKLFEASARLGAILSGASLQIEQGLAAYGMHLGTAFQLIDDVLDYSGDTREMGKNLGDDLNEGKPTLPLIYVMKHGNATQGAAVRRAIEQGGREGFEEVFSAIQQTGALRFAREQAQREAAAACAGLDALPHSNYKQSLLDLAAFAVDRSH